MCNTARTISELHWGGRGGRGEEGGCVTQQEQSRSFTRWGCEGGEGEEGCVTQQEQSRSFTGGGRLLKIIFT